MFSFIGFNAYEAKVGTQSTINVLLSVNDKLLDEVQVIGYGTTTRRLKTSGVGTIKADEIVSQPTTTNFLQSMQGKLSGVAVEQNVGGIGVSPKIYIRGINSVNSGTSPLYVVDGVFISDGGDITNSGLSPDGSHSALSSINQDDIIRIDVLKDADATAIYGSRGANGVVLITTKRAEIGKTSFTINASTGFNDPVTSKYLNLNQYLALRKEAYAVTGETPDETNALDLLTWSQTTDYNYPKLLNNGSGSIYNINGSLTGGTKNLSFLASIGYNKATDTYFAEPYDKKISGKLNLNHTSDNNKLKASVNISFVNEDYHPATGSMTSTAAGIYTLPPNFPMYNTDGSYYWGATTQGYPNYYAIAKSTNQQKAVDYLLSGDFSYLLYKGLTAKLAVSYDYHNANNLSRTYVVSQSPFSPGKASIGEGYNTFTSFNIEPQLTYATTIDKAKIDALVGTTWYTTGNNGISVGGTNFLAEAFMNAYGTASTQTISNYRGNYNVRSWFGRVNSIWDNKYIANFTFRGDGSSKFGPDNRWGYFGSVGAAWIFTNESWVKKALPWWSLGKLRASYGTTGNDKIDDFLYKKLYSANGSLYNLSPAIGASLPNSKIKWETTHKSEIGLENSFLNERLFVSFALFYNRTTDLLMSVSIPSQTGSSTIVENFDGKVDNKGIEIEINSTNIKSKKFTWQSTFNITFQKNVLINPSDNLDGKSLNNFTGYVFSRIDPATGHVLWINQDTGEEQASINGLTRQYLGSKLPTIFGGLTNSLSYKGFTLDFTISFAKKMMTNALYFLQNYPGSASNVPTILLGHYWQKAGDVADYPGLNTIGTMNTSDAMGYYYGNTLHEGFYFKMQNISLSYTLPTKWIAPIGGQSASVYLRGQNLFYVTPGVNLGKDPERENPSGLGLLRTFVAGLTVKF